MPSLNHILLTAISAVSFVEAAPAPTLKVFSVKQAVVNAGFKTQGAHQMLNTYVKFRAVPPAPVVAAVKATGGSGSVVAAPADIFDSEYLCPVTVGGTVLQLDFDTGSSDLWAFSTMQPTAQSVNHHLYKPSSTAKQLTGANWTITYGDGSSAQGVVYSDSVTIGGVTVAAQAVEVATSVSAGLVANKADGFVGLAFDSINQVQPTPQRTFLSNVSPSLPSPIMVANLKYHAAGGYDFGFINASRYTGSITYTPVNTASGYWQIPVSGYGSTAAGPVTVNPIPIIPISFSAIMDTGTSLVYLPSTILSAYYSKVSGAQNSNTYGGWVVPCNAVMPNFALSIGGSTSVVPGKYIIYGPVASGSNVCYGGLQDSAGIGFSILGDIFIKANMVVFDNSAVPRIGLATPSSLT